jgi:D-glycero-alpha-D-manno-heptose-7-phosphate kinase
VKELEALLLLCYTGAARLSSAIHQNVWENLANGHRDVRDALIRMRDSAFDAKDALEEGDFERFGKILSLQFESSKILDSSTTNEALENVFTLVRGEIIGGKPCGAGGGGCVVFCCKGEKEKQQASEKLKGAGLSLIDFTFDFQGVRVSVEN